MEYDQEDKRHRSSDIGEGKDDRAEKSETIYSSENPRDFRESRIFNIYNGYITLSICIQSGEGRIKVFSNSHSRSRRDSNDGTLSERVKTARRTDYRGLALSFPVFSPNRIGEGATSVINWLKALGWEPNEEKEERLKEVLKKRNLRYE